MTDLIVVPPCYPIQLSQPTCFQALNQPISDSILGRICARIGTIAHNPRLELVLREAVRRGLLAEEAAASIFLIVAQPVDPPEIDPTLDVKPVATNFSPPRYSTAEILHLNNLYIEQDRIFNLGTKRGIELLHAAAVQKSVRERDRYGLLPAHSENTQVNRLLGLHPSLSAVSLYDALLNDQREIFRATITVLPSWGRTGPNQPRWNTRIPQIPRSRLSGFEDHAIAVVYYSEFHRIRRLIRARR